MTALLECNSSIAVSDCVPPVSTRNYASLENAKMLFYYRLFRGMCNQILLPIQAIIQQNVGDEQFLPIYVW